MANEPAKSNTTTRRDREREGRKPGFEQALLILVMWIVPLSLFGYVGFHLSTALGADWVSMVPDIAMWKLAVGAVALLALVAGALGIRARQARRAMERTPARWDSYTTPF